MRGYEALQGNNVKVLIEQDDRRVRTPFSAAKPGPNLEFVEAERKFLGPTE
jgi:hypothetical protein